MFSRVLNTPLSCIWVIVPVALKLCHHLLYIYTLRFKSAEAVVRRCSVEKAWLEISQNSQENTCARVSFLIKLQAQSLVFKKETLAQVFSCELYEISKNTFFYRTPPVAASKTEYATASPRSKQRWPVFSAFKGVRTFLYSLNQGTASMNCYSFWFPSNRLCEDMSNYFGVIYCTKNGTSFLKIYLVSANKFAVH